MLSMAGVRDQRVQRSILSTLGAKLTEGFTDFDIKDPRATKITDPMLQNKWVNISVSIRARNLSRPALKVYKGYKESTSGPLFSLFQSPNANMSMKAMIWLSSMWWDIEGEFFWWFGGKAGFPKEIYVLSPRRMEYETYSKKWFFTNDEGERIPMAPEEFFHCYEPNIWNPIRGVPPMAALAMELEQDWSVNKELIKALNASAIPQGILKTEQRITPAQADDIQLRWDQKYGRSKGDKRIAVLGQGTSFQALNEDLLKYTTISEDNRTAILTKYGIPLKVANATSEKTALSGKDSDEQYRALWSQTLIPVQKFWAGEIKTKFLNRFGLNTYSVDFDNTDIPELQEQEADLHKRLREDIAAGLLTPNEAREIIHYDAVENGDTLRGGQAPEKPADQGVSDADTETGEPAKSGGRRARSVFQGQFDKQRSAERRDNALQGLFDYFQGSGG